LLGPPASLECCDCVPIAVSEGDDILFPHGPRITPRIALRRSQEGARGGVLWDGL
jgi:hypothetical protein